MKRASGRVASQVGRWVRDIEKRVSVASERLGSKVANTDIDVDLPWIVEVRLMRHRAPTCRHSDGKRASQPSQLQLSKVKAHPQS